MSISRFYIDCVKSTKTETLNSKLVPITNYTDTNIKGYVGHSRNKLSSVAGKMISETVNTFYTSDLTIKTGDVIIYNDKKYEVLSQPQNTINKNHHIKALIRILNNIKQ